MRRAGALAAIALTLAACSLGSPPEDADGEEIYVQLCARCHDADLSGGVGPALGPDSNAAAESDEYFEFTITNGRGRMPSFSSLSDDQIDRLVGYMREIQSR